MDIYHISNMDEDGNDRALFVAALSPVRAVNLWVDYYWEDEADEDKPHCEIEPLMPDSEDSRRVAVARIDTAAPAHECAFDWGLIEITWFLVKSNDEVSVDCRALPTSAHDTTDSRRKSA